jgi:hypothetical protein
MINFIDSLITLMIILKNILIIILLSGIRLYFYNWFVSVSDGNT